MYRYNYIILGSGWDLYRHAYSDIIGLSNVKYYKRPVENPVLNLIHRIHTNPLINSIVSIPGKKWWNYLYYNTKFDEPRPLCFIIFYDWYLMNNGVISHIRAKYPHSKIVVVFSDLVDAKVMRYTNAPVDMEYIKKESDFVVSFDFKDAEKYGIVYHNVPYSVHEPAFENRSDKNVDVYFIGQAKDRLEKIMDVFYCLKRHGLSLNFILSNVPEDKRIVSNEITYLDGIKLSYDENLQNVMNAGCILEILQKGGTGYTVRTLEAVAYGRKLLTDNSYIRQAPFYSQSCVSFFRNPNDIDVGFLSGIVPGETVDYHYKEKLSPKEFLNFIESNIS